MFEVRNGGIPVIDPMLEKVRDSGKSIMDFEISGETVSQPGVQRHWTASYFPIVDDKGIGQGVGSIVVEITDRKRMEEALRASEDQYRSVVDNIGIGVALISPNMEILALNSQLRQWFPSIEVREQPLCYRAFNDPPRDELCSYCPTCATLQDGQIHEATTETPTGDMVKHYRVVASPIKDAAGKVVAAVELVEDITERIQKDREIALLNRLYNVLSQVNQAVVRATDPDAFLEQACRLVAEDGKFPLAWIGQLNETTRQVLPVTAWGDARDYVGTITVYADERPEGQGPMGTCIRERHSVVFNDFLHDTRTPPWQEQAAQHGLRAAAAFPIESAGRVWGRAGHLYRRGRLLRRPGRKIIARGGRRHRICLG